MYICAHISILINMHCVGSVNLLRLFRVYIRPGITRDVYVDSVILLYPCLLASLHFAFTGGDGGASRRLRHLPSPPSSRGDGSPRTPKCPHPRLRRPPLPPTSSCASASPRRRCRCGWQGSQPAQVGVQFQNR